MILAIDLGQSGSRIRLGETEIELSRGKHAGETPLDSLRAIAPLLPKLSADIATLSLTGFNGIVHDPNPYQSLCNEHFGVSQTAVIDDGLASFFGALGGVDGVALAIGGGVVAVAGMGKTFSHTDGLGSTFGDEGGAFWLGSRAITRALATREKRDVQHELLDYFGDEVIAYDDLQVKNAADGVLLAIKSAKKVLEAADAHVKAAVAIRDEGSNLLANSVCAAWLLAGGAVDQDLEFTIAGGLAKNESYVHLISEKVSHTLKNAIRVDVRGDNLDGALWIAENMKDDSGELLKWAR